MDNLGGDKWPKDECIIEGIPSCEERICRNNFWSVLLVLGSSDTYSMRLSVVHFLKASVLPRKERTALVNTTQKNNRSDELFVT